MNRIRPGSSRDQFVGRLGDAIFAQV